MQIAKWDLSPTLGETRLNELMAPSSFEAIVEHIRTRMEVLCCHPETADIASFERIIYCIKISPSLFDLLFNSSSGYRASYYHSPYEGLRANDYLIQSLLPVLIASRQTQSAKKDTKFITESLTSPSAKLWLAEPEHGFCPSCNGEWVEPKTKTAEILNDRWEWGECSNAIRGRKAPFLTKIRVFGAFVNAGYDEFVPERKRHRARHIHERGWA